MPADVIQLAKDAASEKHKSKKVKEVCGKVSSSVADPDLLASETFLRIRILNYVISRIRVRNVCNVISCETY